MKFLNQPEQAWELLVGCVCVEGGGGGYPLMCSAPIVYMVHTRGGVICYLRGGLNIIEDFSNGIRC